MCSTLFRHTDYLYGLSVSVSLPEIANEVLCNNLNSVLFLLGLILGFGS